MARPRRVGSENSETRDQLLDAVEDLMLERGYASVSYRAVAAHANATAGLVQYYFPKIDDLFVASIRRYSRRNLKRLDRLLASHADQPLHALWEYSCDDASATLTLEYMALGNHRPPVRSEITKATRQVHRVQLAALEARGEGAAILGHDVPPKALVFFLTGIPRLIKFNEGVGIRMGHKEVVGLIESNLADAEPAE